MPTESRIRQVLEQMKKTYALARVSIFGSYAENRATEESDLDLLVEFEPAHVSLITLNQLKYALEDELGLSVDIIHGPLPEGSMIQPRKVVQVL